MGRMQDSNDCLTLDNRDLDGLSENNMLFIFMLGKSKIGAWWDSTRVVVYFPKEDQFIIAEHTEKLLFILICFLTSFLLLSYMSIFKWLTLNPFLRPFASHILMDIQRTVLFSIYFIIIFFTSIRQFQC